MYISVTLDEVFRYSSMLVLQRKQNRYAKCNQLHNLKYIARFSTKSLFTPEKALNSTELVIVRLEIM